METGEDVTRYVEPWMVRSGASSERIRAMRERLSGSATSSTIEPGEPKLGHSLLSFAQGDAGLSRERCLLRRGARHLLDLSRRNYLGKLAVGGRLDSPTVLGRLHP